MMQPGSIQRGIAAAAAASAPAAGNCRAEVDAPGWKETRARTHVCVVVVIKAVRVFSGYEVARFMGGGRFFFLRLYVIA